MENTPEVHADHSHLKLALERAEELCSQVNEGVREKENSDRLEWIESHVQCDGLAEVRMRRMLLQSDLQTKTIGLIVQFPSW